MTSEVRTQPRPSRIEEKKVNMPVLGDIAAILTPLRSKNYLTLEDVRAKATQDTGLEIDFNTIWNYVFGAGLVNSEGPYLSLTEAGESWLDAHGVDLAVEEELVGSDGKPTEPYAVSKLKMEPKHLSVFQALRKIEKGEINLNPDFQRAFVWDEVKQSRLIESILIRIPLPAFYLDATDQVNWSVVDGLQRLTTLYRYCRNESFRLKGLQFLTELENCRFQDLPSKYQVLVEDDTQLLFYNLMPGTPVEAKFTIFSRVNTGGMVLTPQEIRHALNQGPVTTLLKDLAVHQSFRSATEGVVESLRMSDRELILRALSFIKFGVDVYRNFNELDAFLLNSMAKINRLSDVERAALKSRFISSMLKVKGVFGKYAFRKFSHLGGRRSPFNKALFETWTVAVDRFDFQELLDHRHMIASHFADLVANDIAFGRSISSSTGSFTAVNTRFGKINNLLDKVMQ